MEDLNLTPEPEAMQNAATEVAATENTQVEPAEVQTPVTPSPAPEAEAPVAETAPAQETPAAEPAAEAPAEEAPKTEPEAKPEAEAKPEEFVEPEVDYTAMNREELLGALNDLLEQDVPHIKNRVAQIRVQFTALNKEAQKAAFDAFLADGGNKDEYQPSDDAVAEAFHKAYGRYRDLRQKYNDALDAQKKKNLAEKQQILEDLRQLIDRDEETLKKNYDDFNAIQDRWKNIGDVPRENLNDLWQTYHFLIEQFFNKVNINKELRMLDLKRNLEQKMQLCEKAEELIVESSITKAFKGLQNLRAQWREIGPVPSEQNEEIWQRFNAAADQIDARRKEYYDQRKEEFDKNLLAKQALLDKALELTENMPQTTKEWNDTTTALDELLKIWKTIGPVPREANDDIWNKFKSTIDKHYAQKKEHFGAIRDEQSENYNKKIDLCLKAEAIAKREDWKKATEELLKLQAEWKEIGAVSRKVSDKIWHRFRGACDEFFAKKTEYFNNIHGAESENLAKKEAIIAQIKEYQFGDDKEENLNVIKDFQRQWMEIGFVPIKEKDRLQKEFREAINAHFEKLKISAREAEETAYRERIRNFAGDAKKAINSEKDELIEKIQKLRSDIQLWENNLGFFASSKQADLLKKEFEQKMQSARQQIALLEAKLRILKETDEAEKTEKKEE